MSDGGATGEPGGPGPAPAAAQDDGAQGAARVRRRTALLASGGAFVGGWAASKALDAVSGAVEASLTPPLRVTPRDNAPARDKAEFDAIAFTPGAPQYVLPISEERLLASQPSLDRDVDLDAWARKLGGVPSSAAIVELTVGANEGRILDVIDIRVDVVSRGPALTGIYMAPEGGGDYWEYTLSADLDTDPVTYRRVFDFGDETWNFPFTVSGDEKLIVYVYAHTDTQTVEFNVLFDLYDPDADERTTQIVNRRGVPYKVTGLSNAATSFVFRRGQGIENYGPRARGPLPNPA
ncbi:hypothetical protein ACFFKU_18320 [Kineococcus gynurae]|uniref:Uncharacterized protein n=1 Tax=Kineococcus gynurae TaxID=452979 RepID=A0ABV5LNC6_9ACTN